MNNRTSSNIHRTANINGYDLCNDETFEHSKELLCEEKCKNLEEQIFLLNQELSKAKKSLQNECFSRKNLDDEINALQRENENRASTLSEMCEHIENLLLRKNQACDNCLALLSEISISEWEIEKKERMNQYIASYLTTLVNDIDTHDSHQGCGPSDAEKWFPQRVCRKMMQL